MKNQNVYRGVLIIRNILIFVFSFVLLSLLILSIKRLFLDIDVIKSITGEFTVDEIIQSFSNFFFNRMFLDITSIKDYQNITIFKVTQEGVYKIATVSDTDMIIFSITELGQYVATGVLNPDVSQETEDPGNSLPTLQNGENTGIIPTLKPIPSKNNEGAITPGAFIFWLLTALVIGLWVGILVGYILWGRYKTKKMQRGPYVIGE